VVSAIFNKEWNGKQAQHHQENASLVTTVKDKITRASLTRKGETTPQHEG
jgi:hypothetical protein